MYLNGLTQRLHQGANTVDNIDFSITEKKLEDTINKLIADAIDNAM
jgi:uncharacterized protein YggE